MTKYLLLLLCIFFFVQCKRPAQDFAQSCPEFSIVNGKKYTSIIGLISNPSCFQEADVRVDGFLLLEFEGEALYLDEGSYLNNMRKNAIRLVQEKGDTSVPKEYNKKYVTLEGRFIENTKDSKNLYSGFLKNVSVQLPVPSSSRNNVEWPK